MSSPFSEDEQQWNVWPSTLGSPDNTATTATSSSRSSSEGSARVSICMDRRWSPGCSPALPTLLISPTTSKPHPPAQKRTQAATPGVVQGQQGDAGAPGLPAATAAAPPFNPGQQQQQQQQLAAASGQGDGLILTDLVPDALALVYDCLPSKEDKRSLLHSCRAIHSLPQLRAKVGAGGWV